MNRNSSLYFMRRKLQIYLFHLIPSKFLSQTYYYFYLHKKCNLKNPKTLNEKLQWYKLNYCPYDNNVIRCTDKYQVREYLEKKKINVPMTRLLGVWDKPNEIIWDNLPQKYVLKCTHGCAYNIVCKDNNLLDKNKTKKLLNRWLNEDFSKFNVELHYGKIKKRRIICEEFLGDKIIDYKFFCFNGIPKFYYVSEDLLNDRQAKMGFFEMNGEKINLIRNDYQDIGTIKKSKFFDEMNKITTEISKDFPFVRVDFFVLKNSFKFAELTFTPGAAMMPISPKIYDEKWGEFLNLEKI